MFKKLVVLITAVLVTQVTFGAVFIKFDGVDGESQAQEYEGYSEVLSWSWGSLASAKSTCIQDFNFVKEVDKSSPILLLDQVRGRAYPEVNMAVTSFSADGSRKEYLTLEFTNVRMSSHSTSATADSIPFEQISLQFEEVTYTYFTFDQRGQPRDTVTATIKSTGKC